MVDKPPLPPRNISATPSLGRGDASFVDSTQYEYSSPSPSPSPSLHPADAYRIYPGGLHDPRTSSTQSLRPIESAGRNRRTLLIIYIHGFMGDETSFKSFPAHVHSLLTNALVETHVVYTKIYPRYKSRKNISFARDDFSNWITPHEQDSTDVILVGHSLGGILAAEVALLPSHNPRSNEISQHRILGVLCFDVPFLGMHPGVVGTGIASLFRSAPEAPERPLANSNESHPLSDPSWGSSDPTYNPAYPNDNRLATRNGKLSRAWYFWNKHAGEVFNAAGKYVSSHVEFGGCLADYPGLRRRYNAIRALEDVDEFQQPRDPNGRLMKQVRFVNYYSASTGRIKEIPESSPRDLLEPPATEMQTLKPPNANTPAPSGPSSPRLSLEEHRDGEIITKSVSQLNIDPDPGPAPPSYDSIHGQNLERSATAESNFSPTGSILSPSSTIDAKSLTSRTNSDITNLPPIPDLPPQPPQFDPSPYQDDATLRIYCEQHERQTRAYERAVKDREKSIKAQEKLLAKRRREVAKQEVRAAKLARQQEQKLQKEQVKRSATLNPEDYDNHLRRESEQAGQSSRQAQQQAPRKQKDRKFCSLPGKDTQTGQRDPTWIRVYMEGMDEVVAHTSMFQMSETYVKMVGDTAERIERWVAEDATKRMLLVEMKAEGVLG
ncbi:hypothetical protein B0A52_02349 [Exophiala mesophila]|uniref:AB hydrolase-1 domain-containing protein n=1 Tax=Exophiala mesophila TaxID=212818 RepID=A0A438NC91_EXOME|nr:hypothetical protein B0A52_02349 [Exophiala mesophila]